MSKTVWIVANWKSNKTIAESLDWVDAVGPILPKGEHLKVAVCPSFLAIEQVKKTVLVGGYPLLVGAQNISPFGLGAYTGEVAAELLKEVADITIIGHSERRDNFAETDKMIDQKVQRAQEAGIIPLVCVQNEETPIPENVQIVAYEPVFAIGTGNPDTPENANRVAKFIKEYHQDNLQVLYGGSVNPDNAYDFLSQDQINGLLIGGASLDAAKFTKIIKIAAELS